MLLYISVTVTASLNVEIAFSGSSSGEIRTFLDGEAFTIFLTRNPCPASLGSLIWMMELLISFQNALRAVLRLFSVSKSNLMTKFLATDRNLLEDKSFSEPQDGHNVRIVMRSA